MKDYHVICKWDEDGKTKWDAVTFEPVTKEVAETIKSQAVWDGPSMNERFVVITKEKYDELLAEDTHEIKTDN